MDLRRSLVAVAIASALTVTSAYAQTPDADVIKHPIFVEQDVRVGRWPEHLVCHFPPPDCTPQNDQYLREGDNLPS